MGVDEVKRRESIRTGRRKASFDLSLAGTNILDTGSVKVSTEARGEKIYKAVVRQAARFLGRRAKNGSTE